MKYAILLTWFGVYSIASFGTTFKTPIDTSLTGGMLVKVISSESAALVFLLESDLITELKHHTTHSVVDRANLNDIDKVFIDDINRGANPRIKLDKDFANSLVLEGITSFLIVKHIVYNKTDNFVASLIAIPGPVIVNSKTFSIDINELSNAASRQKFARYIIAYLYKLDIVVRGRFIYPDGVKTKVSFTLDKTNNVYESDSFGFFHLSVPIAYLSDSIELAIHNPNLYLFRTQVETTKRQEWQKRNEGGLRQKGDSYDESDNGSSDYVEVNVIRTTNRTFLYQDYKLFLSDIEVRVNNLPLCFTQNEQDLRGQVSIYDFSVDQRVYSRKSTKRNQQMWKDSSYWNYNANQVGIYFTSNGFLPVEDYYDKGCQCRYRKGKPIPRKTQDYTDTSCWYPYFILEVFDFQKGQYVKGVSLEPIGYNDQIIFPYKDMLYKVTLVYSYCRTSFFQKISNSLFPANTHVKFVAYFGIDTYKL